MFNLLLQFIEDHTNIKEGEITVKKISKINYFLLSKDRSLESRWIQQVLMRSQRSKSNQNGALYIQITPIAKNLQAVKKYPMLEATMVSFSRQQDVEENVQNKIYSSDRRQYGLRSARNSKEQQICLLSRPNRAVTSRVHKNSKENVRQGTAQLDDFSMLRDEIIQNAQVGRSLQEAEKKAQSFVLETTHPQGGLQNNLQHSIAQQNSKWLQMDLNKSVIFGSDGSAVHTVDARRRRNKTAKETFDCIFNKRSLTVQRNIKAYFEKMMLCREQILEGYRDKSCILQNCDKRNFTEEQEEDKLQEKVNGQQCTLNKKNNQSHQNMHKMPKQHISPQNRSLFMHYFRRKQSYFSEKKNSFANITAQVNTVVSPPTESSQVPAVASQQEALQKLIANIPHYEKNEHVRRNEVLSALQKYIEKMHTVPIAQEGIQSNGAALPPPTPQKFNSIKNILQYYQKQQSQFEGLRISQTLPLRSKDIAITQTGSELLHYVAKNAAAQMPQSTPGSSASTNASQSCAKNSKNETQRKIFSTQPFENLHQDQIATARSTRWLPKKSYFQAKNYVQELSHKMQKEKSPAKAHFDCGPWFNPEEERLSDLEFIQI